jgi:hypothetical protein
MLQRMAAGAAVAWSAPIISSIRPQAALAQYPCRVVNTVFSDNFEQDECANNPPSITNWTITQGVIDLTGGECGAVPTPTKVVDLEGSCGPAVIETNMTFSPGTYQVRFELWGNQRGGGPDTVRVTFGSLDETFTLDVNDGPITFVRLATLSSSDKLVFDHTVTPSEDCFGILLDNVAVETCA